MLPLLGSAAARDCSPPGQCRFSGRDGLRFRQGFLLRQGLRRTSRWTRPCRRNFDFFQVWRAPVPRRRADRYKLCFAATRHAPNVGSLWVRRLQGRDCLSHCSAVILLRFDHELEGRRLRRPRYGGEPGASGGASAWSFANFQAAFGNLTGEDARPTLWRGASPPALWSLAIFP